MPVAELDDITESSVESSVDLLREFERTGRPEPFEAFMRRHASMVYATCLKVTRDPHDAEDATQATFLTLASKSRLNGEIRQPEAWLRKVAHRLALDLIRSKKRRVNREAVRSEMHDEAAPLDSHDHADAGEVRGILNEELAKLPASYRMPLILHYFGGLTRDEMAAQLKLKPSTLGVRLHRAREQLRRRLAGRGIALPAVALTALLAEVVRGSVCSHLMASTARQASAIVLGHAAPMMYAGGGTTGLGSISSVIGLLSHGKMKLMLSALIVGSAISLTSAQVQRFLPAVLRNVLPTFHMPSLMPRLDFVAPTPQLFSRAADDDRSDGEAVGVAARPLEVPRTFASLGDTPAASATPAIVVAAIGSGGVASSPRVAEAHPSAGVDRGTRRFDVIDRPQPAALVRSQIASAAVPQSIAAVAVPRTPVRDVKPTSEVTPEPTPVATVPTPTPAHAGSDPWNDVIASADGRSGGASGGASSGPAAPMVSAATLAEDVPDRVLASVTGAAPALQNSSDGAARPINAGGATSTSGRSAQDVVPASSPTTSGGRSPVASRTVVFTGTSANYGGYADASWAPTELTDLNGSLAEGTTPADAPNSFDAASAGPSVPGESLSINGARVTLHQTSKTGSVSVSFVDTSATDIPALPTGHHFIGVWQLDSSMSFASADLLVRYDDLRAARLNLNEQILKLWVSDGATWTLMWLDPSFGRDVNSNLLWVTAAGGFKFFAVSAPEPTVAVTLLAGATLLTRRRR